MIILTKKVNLDYNLNPDLTLYLTAEERLKPRQTIEFQDSIKDKKKVVKINLSRGQILEDQDILSDEENKIFVAIKAKIEEVITVKSSSSLRLLQAAYHLGNRHISLEIKEDYLRFSPDHILENMLEKMGLKIYKELAPFFPETGAYKHSHDH